MPSVLDPYVQDYTSLRYYSPIIPNNRQRTSGPAPFCRRSVRANSQGFKINRSEPRFLWPARCDANLMKAAVRYVPTVVNRYLLAWLDKTSGRGSYPPWYEWYQTLTYNLHNGRHWHHENNSRWEFSEVAAALDAEFAPLRCKNFVWVWPPQMKACIKDLKEHILAKNSITTPFGTMKSSKLMGRDNDEMKQNDGSKIHFVILGSRGSSDRSEEIITYSWEARDFEWGEYYCSGYDYGGEGSGVFNTSADERNALVEHRAQWAW